MIGPNATPPARIATPRGRFHGAAPMSLSGLSMSFPDVSTTGASAMTFAATRC
jgi:hypothetical protein